MDGSLVAWARQVKSRRRRAPGTPVLWLFADPLRLPDPRAAAARLPRGLCGVVLRYFGPAASADEQVERLSLGRGVAAICRERRLALVVAGDPWLAQALRAGVHLRRGRPAPRSGGLIGPRPHGKGPHRWVTSSAHDGVELRRARLAGAAAVFLSPCCATSSHAGVPALGLRRWCAIARHGGLPVLALGGITGRSARALPRRFCDGAGAIGALMGDVAD